MYYPISDYGLIGDLCSTALVSKSGSIDYCCMPNMDSPTVFAALLDDNKGGGFSIHPREVFSTKQFYLPDTAILKTVFETVSGSITLTDFMAIESRDKHVIHRCLHCDYGSVPFLLQISPRPEYATIVPEISQKGNVIYFRNKEKFFSFRYECPGIEEIKIDDGLVEIRFIIDNSKNAHFDFSYGTALHGEKCVLNKTISFWKEWAAHPETGMKSESDRISALINRSLITLKLLTYEPTGAFAASATNGLPEVVGGKMNWDYRFSWIRDSSFTLRAFHALDHHKELHHYITWLLSIFREHNEKRLRVFYPLSNTGDVTERKLDHLCGYLNSRPVLTGNAAYEQNQWDIYGEVIDSVWRISQAQRMEDKLWPLCSAVCELAIKNWRKPDNGIWEKRKIKHHYVYSKVMCWVAVDKCIMLAQKHGFDAPIDRWINERDKIKYVILQKGIDKRTNSFVSHYNTHEVDASLLRIPLTGFLPFDDKRVNNTINRCISELTEFGFLRRYRCKPGEPGEGSFVLCNFWLVQCLAQSNRIEEAENILEKTTHAANHLGLFSEMFDSRYGVLLGNFPQGYGHIGFINAVQVLKEAKTNYKL